jgi:chromate transport protein ChrA
LHAWSEEEYLRLSWRWLVRSLAGAPDELLTEAGHGISSWLEAQAKVFVAQEEQFFTLARRTVQLYRNDPAEAGNRYGRVLLGAHMIALFRVDRNWTAFTLPSAIALVLFAFGVAALGDAAGSAWLHGLKVAAVAVVAQAVLGMMRSLAPDKERASLAVVAAAIALAVPTAWGQIAAIALGAIVGVLFLRTAVPSDHVHLPVPVSRTVGVIALIAFFVLLVSLPFLAARSGDQDLQIIDAFYRSGSLVFGGGHVVLPLLQSEVVPTGWVTNDQFLAGYGAAQAVPGPLFTFAAYLGAVIAAGARWLCVLWRYFFHRFCWWSVRCRSGRQFVNCRSLSRPSLG